MNHLELLKKYMRLVMDDQGTDCLLKEGMNGNIALTDDEMMELWKISDEVSYD